MRNIWKGIRKWLKTRFCGDVKCSCISKDERAERDAAIITRTIVETLFGNLGIETIQK